MNRWSKRKQSQEALGENCSGVPGGMMGDLARFEWDFSSCPRSEIYSCWFYEYARESEVLKRRVLQWRSRAKGNEIDDFLQLTGGRPYSPFHAATYPYLPSWPKTPYLAVEQKVREAWHRLLFPTPQKEAMAYCLEAHIWSRDLNEKLLESKKVHAAMHCVMVTSSL